MVILHPGSGGSSARWPLAHFMELGDKLQMEGYDVIVTGGPGENYQNIMIDNMHRIPVFIAAGSVSLRQLAAIFSCADLVVSNSTGPLHLAVALECPDGLGLFADSDVSSKTLGALSGLRRRIRGSQGDCRA